MSTVFEVLAEPRRRRILDLVRDGERSVGELVDALSMSQPAVSKHLRVLRDAGLVEARVVEQRRLYRLRPEPLRELDAWLAPYRWAWDVSLDRLETRLGEMARREEHGPHHEPQEHGPHHEPADAVLSDHEQRRTR